MVVDRFQSVSDGGLKVKVKIKISQSSSSSTAGYLVLIFAENPLLAGQWLGFCSNLKAV